MQVLNEELAAINEELRASNEEYLLANTALSETQRQLQQLNQELEARVLQRTQETLTMQAELLAAAQRQAREQESFYQVFEQVPVVVALLRGPEHFFHYRNPAFQALFPDRVLTGRLYAEAMPEIVAAGLIPVLDRVYATGQPYYGTALPVVTTPPDGSAPHLRYYDFSYHPYQEGGQTVGLSIFAYDVTEQVLAQRERERQLQSVFEQTAIPITVLRGPKLVVESANDAMCALWGRSPAQVLGKPYFEAVPDTAGQGFEEIWGEVLRTGVSYRIHETPVQLDRAHTGLPPVGNFNFIFQAYYRPDGTGSPVGIIAIGIEVTEQVRARQQVQDLNEELAAINEELTVTNEELHQSNTQLTRTNVDLDTFVYTASHDLKAPITNIESITLALRETLPPAVQQDELVGHLLDLLGQTTARFQFTIGQLTDLSKLQLAHAGPAEPVQLAAVVEGVRLDLAPLIAAAGAQLTVEVPADLVASFSPGNLRSAIYNLLSNAVKYRAPDRVAQVRVHAARTGPRVVLTVKDNGLGISKVQQRQLFGLFQRLHTHVEGTGVGLYITKRLVENGGGTIAVESQVDVGTTFTLTFPA